MIEWLVSTGPVWPLIGLFLVVVFAVDQAIRWWRSNEWRRRRDDDDDDWPFATG